MTEAGERFTGFRFCFLRRAQSETGAGVSDRPVPRILGQIKAPVTIKGYLTTTDLIDTHPVINGAFVAGSPVTLRVAVGDNAASQAGAPEYSGEFLVSSYTPVLENGKAVMFTAVLNPALGTAPAWGTMA